MGPNISLILKLESESLILKFELIRVLKKKKKSLEYIIPSIIRDERRNMMNMDKKTRYVITIASRNFLVRAHLSRAHARCEKIAPAAWHRCTSGLYRAKIVPEDLPASHKTEKCFISRCYVNCRARNRRRIEPYNTSRCNILLLPLVFLVEQSRPSRDNYADNSDARRYSTCMEDLQGRDWR